MVTVDVAPEQAARWNAASARRRWFPFDDDVIDWATPYDATWAYMPAEHSAFSGADWYESRPVEERAFLERWEVTQLIRNIAHGEHLLNMGILAMLWQVDPYDPSYRFLLHEVAEECQHMAMFNEWVRRNDDIDAIGAGEAGWGQEIARFTEDIAVRLPEAFWVNVLLFEFVGDCFNAALRGGPDGEAQPDGRRMHPTLVGIGVAHTAEEARHIGYARAWLRAGTTRLDDAERAEVRQLAELGAQSIIDRRFFLPLRWSDQLLPYTDRATFTATLGTTAGTRATLAQLHELLREFETLGIVGTERLRRWEDADAFS